MGREIYSGRDRGIERQVEKESKRDGVERESERERGRKES